MRGLKVIWDINITYIVIILCLEEFFCDWITFVTFNETTVNSGVESCDIEI